MTSMPDAVSAPPRPASTQRGGSSGDDARDEDFASLVDEAADEESDDAARPESLRKRKAPRPDDPVAVQGTIVQAVAQAVAQAGGGTAAPLMPWMVAAAPAASAMPAPTPTPTPSPAATAGAVAPPPSAAPQAAEIAGSGKSPAGQAAPATPAAASQPAPEPSASGNPTGQTQPALADATAQNGAERPAETPAVLQTVQTSLPGMTSAPSGATAESSPSPDGRESRRDEATDPRTAVRGARGTGRQAAAGKADQPANALPTPQHGQPAPDAAPAPAGRDTAAPFAAPPAT
ncbi:flagellar hook-length control protein FliK, partial [Azospirillum sp. 412522]|nr:flagellar hook-length control protein FliK [Azospirillum sp. 412522]